MKHKNHSFLSYLLIIAFLSAVLFPEPIWASFEDDLWDDTKESLKITGIVVGAIIGIGLIIVLIAGTITEIKGDDLFIQHPMENPGKFSHVLLPLIKKNPVLSRSHLNFRETNDKAFTPSTMKTEDTIAYYLKKSLTEGAGNPFSPPSPSSHSSPSSPSNLFKSSSLFAPQLYKPLFSLPYFQYCTIQHGPLCGYDIERHSRPLLPEHIDIKLTAYRWDKVS